MQIKIKQLSKVGFISLDSSTTSMGTPSISIVATDATGNVTNTFLVGTNDLLCAIKSLHERQRMDK